MEDEDVQLMLAFQRGDHDAFTRLVDRHHAVLLRFFHAHVGNRETAEDCCQEVWRKVFRARRDYEPRARFRTWLFRVARNHFIDHYRSRAKQPSEVALDGGAEDGNGWLGVLPSAEATPLEALDAGELARRIEEALGQLPESHRSVFVMGELQGMRYADIADILEIPVGTVKSRMFNAMRRLREVLADLA